MTYEYNNIMCALLLLICNHFSNRQVLCGACAVHLYSSGCPVVPEPENMPRSPRKLLWLPAPTWGSTRQPECAGVHKEHTSFKSDQLFLQGTSKGNCRGSRNDSSLDKENSTEPLPKRPRRKSSTSKPLGLY